MYEFGDPLRRLAKLVRDAVHAAAPPACASERVEAWVQHCRRVRRRGWNCLRRTFLKSTRAVRRSDARTLYDAGRFVNRGAAHADRFPMDGDWVSNAYTGYHGTRARVPRHSRRE